MTADDDRPLTRQTGTGKTASLVELLLEYYQETTDHE